VVCGADGNAAIRKSDLGFECLIDMTNYSGVELAIRQNFA